MFCFRNNRLRTYHRSGGGLQRFIDLQTDTERNKNRHTRDRWDWTNDLPDGSREIELPEARNGRMNRVLAKSDCRTVAISLALAATPNPKANPGA